MTRILQSQDSAGIYLLFLELIYEILKQSIVKVFAPKEGVTISGLDLKHSPTHLQN